MKSTGMGRDEMETRQVGMEMKSTGMGWKLNLWGQGDGGS